MEYVEEHRLDFDKFSCCRDKDLFPFACNVCNHMMVFCYACDTLYEDINILDRYNHEINHFNPQSPIFKCPNCDKEFEYYYMKNTKYRCKLNEWIDAGYKNVLLNL